MHDKTKREHWISTKECQPLPTREYMFEDLRTSGFSEMLVCVISEGSNKIAQWMK